ncbi:MAG: hypothetical protein QXU71_03055 [Candidatus Aenigmatarchaeota archaeon]
MRRVIFKVSILFLILLVLTFASTFTDKNWSGADFPYKGALFLHNGDYVEVKLTSTHYKIYYLTRYDSMNVPLELMERRADGSWKSIMILHCPGKGYPVGENFDYAPFQVINLAYFAGKQVGLHLRENCTLEGKKYGDCDVLIKVQEGMTVIRWKGVDSRDWCDLDDVAR